mmetsp:Transcript_10666/g.10306  ORF Transcript_10666/g.10306 Transcript_10666/m.10306 type:complete len:513 (+) Transcript_10666:924-2462(+)
MFCEGQSNDYQRNERYIVKPKVIHRECNLILRDEMCADIISVYIPAHIAIAVVVGFKVILMNATVFITRTKKVCLKYSQIHQTSIGILGITRGVQLESLCLRSTTLPRASQPDAHKDYIAPAPRVTISHLVLSQDGNLALWSILGQMIHIKKINVTLKCILCHSNVKEGNVGFTCWSCSNRDCTQPVWTATVVFDDGTGECLVHIEGDPVLHMLKSKVVTTANLLLKLKDLQSTVYMFEVITKADSRKLKELKSRVDALKSIIIPFPELQSKVETFCKQYGEVRYDSYYSRWNKIDPLNSHDDDEVDLDDNGDQDPSGNLSTNDHSWMNSNSSMKNDGDPKADISNNGNNHTRNFYRNSSPANKGDKVLEEYVNSLDLSNSVATMLLTVKIINANKKKQITKNTTQSSDVHKNVVSSSSTYVRADSSSSSSASIHSINSCSTCCKEKGEDRVKGEVRDKREKGEEQVNCTCTKEDNKNDNLSFETSVGDEPEVIDKGAALKVLLDGVGKGVG